MSNEGWRVSMIKRALERQLRRTGVTRRAAEIAVARLSQAERWQRLSLKDRAEIAWKILNTPERTA